MMKVCENCKTHIVKCKKCIKAGAFDRNGGTKFIHVGECVYETCKYCEQITMRLATKQ